MRPLFHLMDDLIYRVGTFFLLIGGGALVLFILAAFGSRIDLPFLLIALIGLSLGFAFRRKRVPAPPSSTRFASLKRMNEQNRKRREEREKNRKK